MVTDQSQGRTELYRASYLLALFVVPLALCLGYFPQGKRPFAQGVYFKLACRVVAIERVRRAVHWPFISLAFLGHLREGISSLPD